MMRLLVSENNLNMLDLIWTWSYYLALFLLPIMLYCLVRTRTKSRYSNRDWFYVIKYLYAKRAVKKFQDKCARTAKEITREDLEKVKKVRSDKYRDHHYIYGLDQNGNSLSLKLTIRPNLTAEVYLVLRLADGATYTLPDKARLCSISKWQWKAGGVRIEILEPLKRMRITHNGMLLRSTGEAHEDGLQHVQFNFMLVFLRYYNYSTGFNSMGLPNYYPQDASTNSLADSIASETWRDGRWMNLLGDERGYEQFGALHGIVRGEAFREDLILNLPACRTRFWGTNENLSLKRSVRLFVVASDGTGINVWIKSLKKGCQSINHGNVLFNTGNMSTIDDCDFRLRFVGQHGSIPSIFTVNIKAKNKDFNCVFHVKASLKTVSSEAKGYTVIESQAECDFNSIQGKATVEFWYSQDGPGCELPAPLISSSRSKQNDVESKAYVVAFKDEQAKFVNLTGGKGSSLATLTSINSQDFKVPDGFVVTTKSFEEHYEKSFNLKKALSILEDLCFGKTGGDLKAACEEVAILFRTEKLSEALAEDILKSTSEAKKYAVRSSGVAEDTEELSAAGQNETFLGVSRNQILESVSKCWASLFSYQSVKYRHQHGLPIKSHMAVVIQEMVPSQVAGVLFTCHPSSGNPSDILITANYGLGESVVSGTSEPDTIIVNRYAGTLMKTLGGKEIVIRMGEGNATEAITNDNKAMCVSDAQCAALAKVAVVIEAAFGDARDIEWAFDQEGQLYLLQSRPITTLQSWTDAELLHEFDTPTFTDDVVFTVANAGEVFPGSQSTLTLSSVCQVIDTSIQSTVLEEPDPSAMKCLSIFQNHVFIDVVNGMHRNPQKNIQMTAKLLDLSIFGHPVINETINNIGIQRFGIKTRRDLQKETWKMIKSAWRLKKNVGEMTKGARDLDDEITSKDTAEEMYQKIDHLIVKIQDVFKYHVPITSTSVFYQMIEMSILVGSSQEITSEHYNDIALILSSNDDVISAEIPTTLERIAKALQEKRTEFLQVGPKDGVAWLKANCPEASEILDKFLHDHGHRVLGEFDIYKNTWGLDPSQIIKMIQTNCTAATANHRPVAKPEIDAIIADLKSPKNNFTRKMLRFLLKRSRKAVGARELSKCEAVRTIHKLRLAYRKLAAKMAQDGLIPSADLIFHLSHYEIKEIVVHKTKRTPQLMQKAWRRQRLHPAWDKLKFPELSYGLPIPEDDSCDHRAGCGSDVRLEGTPVCSGTVKARACVITGLDEIDQLHHGDILITYCTDIGWSPYFPMLAGIVTELGGLVSHVVELGKRSHSFFTFSLVKIAIEAECDFNSTQGKATVEFWYSQDGPGCELPAPLILSGRSKQNDVESKAYVIGFKDEQAKFVNLTGGKGSSLTTLTSINSQDFKVPDGFVVTTKSFEEHYEKSFNLKKALSILEDLCFGKTGGDLKAACEEVAILFRTEKLSEALAEDILKSTSEAKKYAVRSSGVAEDTEELSAAGQNETFLGVSRNRILESVSKCWASLFSYQSVKYRHQHGLPIKSHMAVVIQEMVPSQVAGVLFTCHPSSGNPSDILITANYGLGESVVSGTSEPDTIIVNRYAGTLMKTLGGKEIVIRMGEGNATEAITNDNKAMCVSDAQCAALAKVAVVIEAAFGDARDIEWAFDQDGQLYLLQSRPITTLQSWTDAELLHEFDTPTFTDDVVFTVANAGEVFPGSQSTLTLSSVCQVIDTSIQSTVLEETDPSAMKCLSIFQNHVFIDVVNGMHRNPQKNIQMTAKLLDLSIFGHPVINETINNIGIQRFGIKTRRDLQKETWKMIKSAWRLKKNVGEMTKGARDLDDEITSKDTAEEMYQKIDRLIVKIQDVFKYHVPITSTSVFYQMIEMSILVGSSQEITSEHYNDIALILSSNDDVISAEIPTTLERIAKALQEKRTEFLQVDPKDGVAWLKANCPEASEILDKFLHDHGHRVLGEFDIYKNTWGLDPSQIIKMIQTNCTAATANHRPVAKPEIDAIIADLKSPKNNFTRKMLRFLLKRSRKAVGARELSKCEAVRTIHKLRLAYRKLAAKMAQDGLIPSADLIFHLSHYEIKEIVVHKTKRTPQLMRKAWRRQRLHPAWDKLKFPELSYGLPIPEDDSCDHRAGCGSDVRLEGTPVCSGTVKARACVITGLDEIDQLHHGDILITYCTDIGWSPYFPMLAGIVTELGGLVSHGAVVAREYGLPSIVGVKSATRVFKTGDTVLLSGKNGTIELVE